MGVFTGVDDLALAVHDTVDGDTRDDIGLDELKLVYKLRRGPWELGLVVQGWELLLLPAGLLGKRSKEVSPSGAAEASAASTLPGG